MNFAPLEKLIRDRIGLDVASLGAATLPRAVAGRMAARGLKSAESYTGLAAADAAEWAALVGELVVPETWFFRGGVDFFEHLAQWVRNRLNDWPNGRTMRILCVPCSTGEEPYSLAIALDRIGVPAARCTIDGVDLSRDHLLRAVAGLYSAFSFREPNPDPRTNYFRTVDGNRWELLPDYRGLVRFRPGNLVDANFLAVETPYDLILCRNLFIYLTAEGRTRSLMNLERLLAPDGRLCLTPAEADGLPASRFISDGPVALAIFRRNEPPPAPRSGIIRLNPTKPASRSQPILPPRSSATEAAAIVRLDPKPCSASMPPRDFWSDPLREGRSLADAGKLEAARTVCENALGEASPTACLFSLLGVIHLASGRQEDASVAFRKALYLDPDHAEALTHMVVLCEQRGDPGQAEGLRRRLNRIEKGAAP